MCNMPIVKPSRTKTWFSINIFPPNFDSRKIVYNLYKERGDWEIEREVAKKGKDYFV